MKNMMFIAALALGAFYAAAPAARADVNAGDIMVRARLLGVLPDESASVTPIGGSVRIDDSFVPEADLTYFLTNHIGVEVIAAVTPHEVHHTPTNTDLGKVWLLPPTVTLQYHFNPHGKLKPYVGVGVNYTHFYGAKAGALTSVHYSDTWGWALQAGADYQVSKHWYVNVDLKKVNIEPNVTFNGGAIAAAVKINPWIAGVGMGYKF